MMTGFGVGTEAGSISERISRWPRDVIETAPAQHQGFQDVSPPVERRGVPPRPAQEPLKVNRETEALRVAGRLLEDDVPPAEKPQRHADSDQGKEPNPLRCGTDRANASPRENTDAWTARQTTFCSLRLSSTRTCDNHTRRVALPRPDDSGFVLHLGGRQVGKVAVLDYFS
jgi:hypothetical protein